MWDIANLQPACFACNRSKGDRLPGEMGMCPRYCTCGRRECSWTPTSRAW